MMLKMGVMMLELKSLPWVSPILFQNSANDIVGDTNKRLRQEVALCSFGELWTHVTYNLRS